MGTGSEWAIIKLHAMSSFSIHSMQQKGVSKKNDVSVKKNIKWSKTEFLAGNYVD